MTDKTVHRLNAQVHFPSVLIGKTMKRETACRIASYQLWLIARLNTAVSIWNCYADMCILLEAKRKAWNGVIAWLNGSRDASDCYSVQNPFFHGATKIREEEKVLSK